MERRIFITIEPEGRRIEGLVGATLVEVFKDSGEVLEDHAIAFPPLNRLLARRLIERTKVYRLLQGYRNTPPANLDVLEEILIRLAQLVTDFSEIEELDFVTETEPL